MIRTSFVVVACACLVFLLPSNGLAVPADSDNIPPELLEQLTTIRTAALADDYAYHQLSYLTENIGPRPTGSLQADAAAKYVAAELRQLGMEVTLEPVKVPRWVRGAETAELVDYPGHVAGTTQKIVLTALGNSTATPDAGLTAEVVVVHNFDALKGLGHDKVAGKIVLFDVPFDKQKAAEGKAFASYAEAVRYRTGGPKAAADLGAAAALVRSVGNADYRIPHTGFSVPANIPAGAVTAEDAILISDLARQGAVRMHLTLTPHKLPDTDGFNVVADLKGTEHPEQVVVVSGHLDSWDLGTGAIDDGAGVVVAMEAAELMHRLHLHPRRTLRVIAWMDEETGGTGRRAYTKDHSAEFAHYIAAIESDSGASHPLGFSLKVSPAALEDLKPIQEILGSFSAGALRAVEFSPGSDIEDMGEAGVPTIGLTQDDHIYFNYHHTAADTLDKVVPAELRENAAAMAIMAYTLTNMRDPLPR